MFSFPSFCPPRPPFLPHHSFQHSPASRAQICPRLLLYMECCRWRHDGLCVSAGHIRAMTSSHWSSYIKNNVSWSCFCVSFKRMAVIVQCSTLKLLLHSQSAISLIQKESLHVLSLYIHMQSIRYCAVISRYWLTMLTISMDASILLLQITTGTFNAQLESDVILRSKFKFPR